MKEVDKKIEVGDVCETKTSPSATTNPVPPIPKWMMQVEQHWDTIATALSTIKAVPCQTTNVTTGVKFHKFRAHVTVSSPSTNPDTADSTNTHHSREVKLGAFEATPADCLAWFRFPSFQYYDHDLKQERVARRPNVVSLDTLAELMSKVAKVTWDSQTLKIIANSKEVMTKSSPTIEWLNSILKEDDMVDAFRHVFPDAKGRYTCWNQMTNRRYENMGTRIDYTIIDQSLIDCVDKDDSQKLRCCDYPNQDDFKSEEAALHAATASGLFQGASFEGGGIANATNRALETQFGPLHTGIIYTAPRYSDHVGISLHLNEKFDCHMTHSLALNEKDPDTKKAQPHKSQKSISSFFTSGKASKPSMAKRKPNNITKLANKKRGTIMSHFTKKK